MALNEVFYIEGQAKNPQLYSGGLSSFRLILAAAATLVAARVVAV